MTKFKTVLLLGCLATASHQVLAAGNLTSTLNNVGREGQRIMWAIIPVMVLVCGYLYARGKSEASERIEKLAIGGVLTASAFLIVKVFQSF